MKDLIKQVALDVAENLGYGVDDAMLIGVLPEFATAFLAELSKRADAVGTFWHNGNGKWVQDTKERRIKGITQPLFTFPPIHDIEAIENRVAEAVAWKRQDSETSFISNQQKINNWYQADHLYSIPLFTFPSIHDIEAIENRVAAATWKAMTEGETYEDVVISGEWRKYK